MLGSTGFCWGPVALGHFFFFISSGGFARLAAQGLQQPTGHVRCVHAAAAEALLRARGGTCRPRHGCRACRPTRGSRRHPPRPRSRWSSGYGERSGPRQPEVRGPSTRSALSNRSSTLLVTVRCVAVAGDSGVAHGPVQHQHRTALGRGSPAWPGQPRAATLFRPVASAPRPHSASPLPPASPIAS